MPSGFLVNVLLFVFSHNFGFKACLLLSFRIIVLVE